MPEPDRGQADLDAQSPSNPPAPADATIPEEEAREDADTAVEARDEAEKLDAVPYARLKKDEPH